MASSVYKTFDSFEAFNGFPHGWDADFRVTRNDKYLASLRHVAVEGVLINWASYSAPTLQRASTPPGMRTLALPLHIDGPMTWLNYEIDDQSLMLFPENGELFSASSSSMHIATFSIADNLFEQQLAQLDVADPTALREGRASQVGPREWRHLHRCLETLGDFCEKYQDNEAMPDLEGYLAEEAAYQFASMALGSEEGGCRLPVHAAARHTRRAMQYVIPQLRTPLTVAEVCSSTGIGRRTLEQSFRRYLGLSPKQFIKQLRFALCREELLRTPGGRVLDIAQSWGFWHMGQFGRDYRAFFGESPGQTIKRTL